MERNSAQGPRNEIWWKAPLCQVYAIFWEKMVHVVIDMYFSSLGLKIFLNPRLSLIIPLTRCGNQLRYELSVTPLSGFDAFDQFSCFYTKMHNSISSKRVKSPVITVRSYKVTLFGHLPFLLHISTLLNQKVEI